MIKLENIIYKRDDKIILDNISLDIENDIFVAITGPNGSGKSTLAKIIMGIIKPDSGKIIFNDQDITNLDLDQRAKLGIAFAFQQPVTFKGITVYDLLKFASSSEISKASACNILSTVGLCAEEYIYRELNNSLSGGELKRIEIATIISRNSKLTIFDEPEAGIDLWSFNNLIEIFKDIRTAIKGTTIVITHQEKILNIADKIILLNNGKISYYGKQENIINNLYTTCNCDDKKGCCAYDCKS